MRPYLPKSLLITALSAALLISCGGEGEQNKIYEENWESLSQHEEVPDWLHDAKFGIYFHWGVYSVPAFESEWYPKMMFTPGHSASEFHKAHYGDPEEVGYQVLFPLFKAEKFDATQWAKLFKASGAKFAGPVAEHHDGFSMWRSEANPWNAYDMGPKRDLVGELNSAIKDEGLKFITTFHHSRNFQRYTTPESVAEQMAMNLTPEVEYRRFALSHFPAYPTNKMIFSDDPDLRILYGNMDEQEWCEKVWFPKLKEVIDQYQPDIIWFDSWLDQVPESYRQKFCAYYLNEASKLGKEVAIVRKQDDLPLDVSMNDFERSRSDKILDKPWMTDETINKGKGWSYLPSLVCKPAEDVLGILIDNVSKNGILLFNISPMADGTIPTDQQEVLLGVGDWLGKYGESIYGTSPWSVFGEGITAQPKTGQHGWEAYSKVKYSSSDIRITQSDEAVYIHILGVPKPGTKYLIKSLAKENCPQGFAPKSAEFMYSKDNLSWELTPAGFTFTVPTDLPAEALHVIKIYK